MLSPEIKSGFYSIEADDTRKVNICAAAATDCSRLGQTGFNCINQR